MSGLGGMGMSVCSPVKSMKPSDPFIKRTLELRQHETYGL